MTSLRVMFMFSVLFVYAHAFPQSTKDLEYIALSKTGSETTYSQTNHSTTSPEEIAPIVEFVYKVQENHQVEKGTDQQKYSIDPYSEKSSLNVPEKQTAIQKNSNSYSTDVDNYSVTSNKINQNRKLFFPEEKPIIPEGLSKYLNDIYNPILPFPEMYEAQNQRSRNEKVYRSYPPVEERPNKPLHVAGPMLYPIGIARELDLPFFQ